MQLELRSRWPSELRRFEAAPIIIGGCGRSGTTLLASILSCHPRIAVIGPETRAFARGAYPADAAPRAARFDLEALVPHLREAPQTAVRWCEKTPRNVHAFRRLVKLFGGRVHLVHVVRDGRDVVCSFHPDDPRQPWISPARWVEDISAGLSQADLPQLHTVRYEDLVSDLEGTMRRLAEAIEEPDPTPFLRYPEGATLVEHKAWSDQARPVSASSLGRWQRPSLIGYAQALLRHPEAPALLEACGYPAPASDVPRGAVDGLVKSARGPFPTRRLRDGLTRALERRYRFDLADTTRRYAGPLAHAHVRDHVTCSEPGLFIVSPPCGGAEVLAGLLDDHPELVVLPSEARLASRLAAHELAAAYRGLRDLVRPRGGRWVDASPSNLFEADLLRRVFVNARFVVLLRPEAEIVHSLSGRLGSEAAARSLAARALRAAHAVARWPRSMAVDERDLRRATEVCTRRVLRFADAAPAAAADIALSRMRPHLDRLVAAERP